MNQNEIRGNLDTGLLKIIALVCMIIDHAGVRLLGNATEWRLIGRIAFPLYLWCMVVGACYTHSPARYALRLLAVGLISQPCFMLGLNHGWNQLNVFFTLLLGYLGIWGIRENRYGSRIWAPLLALAVPCFVSMDYGWRGVLLAMLLYAARKIAARLRRSWWPSACSGGKARARCRMYLGSACAAGCLSWTLSRAF